MRVATALVLGLLRPRVVTTWLELDTDLAASVAAYWKLDEASSTRADSEGTITLTDNNTVTSDTGKVYDLAAKFTAANSESLSTTDSGALTTLANSDTDFWVAAWFNPANLTGDKALVSLSSSGTALFELWVNEDALTWDVTHDGTNFAADPVTATIASASAWHFAVAYHSATDNEMGLSLDGGAFTVSDTEAAPNGTADLFTLGSLGTTDYMDGLLGPVAFGRGYIPTASDVTALYNGGAGRG